MVSRRGVGFGRIVENQVALAVAESDPCPACRAVVGSAFSRAPNQVGHVNVVHRIRVIENEQQVGAVAVAR